jgi:hypothetical protein
MKYLGWFLEKNAAERGPQGTETFSDLYRRALTKLTKPSLLLTVDHQGQPCRPEDAWAWKWKDEPILYLTAQVPVGSRAPFGATPAVEAVNEEA